MSGVNKVILVGNVGKDPSVGEVGGKKDKVINFSLATSEVYKDRDGTRQEKVEWHNIVAWRKTAEIMEKLVSKGRQMYIEGKIINRSYDDRDGNKRYVTEIEVREFQMLDSKPQNQQPHTHNHEQSSPEEGAQSTGTHGYNNQDDQGRPF